MSNDAGRRPALSRGATASGREGPLSWQQEGRLRRAVLRGGERPLNLVTALPLGEDLTDEEIRRRLELITARQDAMRIVELSLDEGRLFYADEIELPLASADLASPDELNAFVRQNERTPFDGSGAPLWNATLVTLPDGSDGPARYLVVGMDHLITDGLSQQAVTDLLLAPMPGAEVPSGSHHDWVRWQRETFPDPAEGIGPSHEFWAARLKDTTPDQALKVPFCIAPEGEPSGRVWSLRRPAPVPASRLKRAAAKLRTTPFVLVLGAVASTAVAMGAEPDVTFRVNMTGRPMAHLDTLGCFSDNMPVRLSGPDLSAPLTAVRHARETWMSLVPHQTTPWDYLLQAFGGPGDDTLTRRPAQWLVNYMPWEQPSHGLPPVETSGEYESFMGTFQVVAMMYDDDTCRLECEFDPTRFDVAASEEFLTRLCATLADLCEQLTG
ncbi:condensation domain-containing protein [Streptomyces antimicrobicus]|uniref:Condensation domain-containing protein n=1 Tax=Streptomyces antimicrobicus TaxID=2883108 RepID=A0ABS8B0Y8_9ACTN|nr:condensation domain-containing protein [Streptomyces antimicrobicus]MCB5178240.1 condensation domain-containing protein [Streptomyces antimicrobicus]